MGSHHAGKVLHLRWKMGAHRIILICGWIKGVSFGRPSLLKNKAGESNLDGYLM